MSGVGRLERIWVKRALRGPMDAVGSAELQVGTGIIGNADQGGRRQLTILAAERWRRVEAELGVGLDPALRRANLLVSGFDLADTRGRVLTVDGLGLRIGGETRPCRLMDEAHDGLQDALDLAWGGGAYATVLDPGTITVGAAVTLGD
jgi:MOSC domain-containing protein YiiM